MTTRPLALVDPQLTRFMAGDLMRLRRPVGTVLDSCRAGDRFWIREPFHLEQQYEDLRPTAAGNLGAQPVFTDQAASHPTPLGRRRFARECLRAWHRQHAVLIDIVREPIQQITDGEIRSEGFANREQFARYWNSSGVTHHNRGDELTWQYNPTALVLTLQRRAGPLP